MYIYIHMCKDELLWPLTLSLSLCTYSLCVSEQRERGRGENLQSIMSCVHSHMNCVYYASSC